MPENNKDWIERELEVLHDPRRFGKAPIHERHFATTRGHSPTPIHDRNLSRLHRLLEGTTDPSTRKAIKAAIYEVTERVLAARAQGS